MEDDVQMQVQKLKQSLEVADLIESSRWLGGAAGRSRGEKETNVL